MAEKVLDYGRLRSWLGATKDQSENNSRYQTIDALIGGVEKLEGLTNEQIARINAALAGIKAINTYEPDIQFAPATLILEDLVGMALIKDVYGTAAANNITITGTVQGTVNPTINTNFGFLKIYKGSNGAFVFWG